MTTGTTTTSARPTALTLWGALVIVYVVWGSTYLAIRVLVEDMPPLLTAGARFVIAGLLAAAILAVRHGPGVLRVRPVELRGAAIVGVLLLAGGNGGVSLGERTVPSGIAALLVAMVPLWVILLRRASGDRPRALTWIGVLVGFVGLGVLVLPGGGGGWGLAGMALIIGAAASWAIGSFASQRMPVPANPFVATVWEMLAGGLALGVAGMVRGERVEPLSAYSTESLLAFGYLIVFGSLVAFTAYVWLLENARLSLVSTYAYVNPVVAVALGAVLLDEAITVPVVVGGAVVVLGVALVVTAERAGSAGSAQNPDDEATTPATVRTADREPADRAVARAD